MRRRMTELSMSPPPANGALVRPAVHNQRSDPAMHAYNSFVEQIMAQKTEEWAHKETALEEQLRLLQTQLADEQKRSSETAARAEEEMRKGEELGLSYSSWRRSCLVLHTMLSRILSINT